MTFKNKDVLNIIDPLSDAELHQLMTNLAGHDVEELSEVFSHLRKVESLFVLFAILLKVLDFL